MAQVIDLLTTAADSFAPLTEPLGEASQIPGATNSESSKKGKNKPETSPTYQAAIPASAGGKNGPNARAATNNSKIGTSTRCMAAV
ncbi:MAG: hypothetical protein R3C10_12815 [Pirellulales bacterium]